MKIIHAADIHLGSKIESKFPKEITSVRRKEILDTFSRMVSYAKEHDVKVIILAGDVFDKDKPAMKDRDFFYKTVKNNPEIDFLYLKGNHDIEGSYEETNIPNLKTFNSNEIKTYSYGNIDISGIEMVSENYKSLYSKIILNKERINIFVLHGDDSNTFGVNKIRIDSLANKGIDYLALGHYHSYKEDKIDERGRYAFSGCLEGRGFDECGEKGFILLDIDKVVKSEFIPFAKRVIHEIDVDVTGSNDVVDAKSKVDLAVKDINKDDILLINLVGNLPVSAEITADDIKIHLSSKFYFVHVKNKTNTLVRLEDYENDKSLIGEFVRGVYANEEYTPEMKQKILSVGIKLIMKREVER